MNVAGGGGLGAAGRFAQRGRASLASASAFAFVVGLATTATEPSSADACATVSGPERPTPAILDEEALIAWDPDSGTEHFVRRATFLSDADSFGFLVPTPTAPELGEVDEGVFGRLTELLTPPVKLHRKVAFEPTLFFAPTKSARSMDTEGTAQAEASAVRVLDAQRVAGLSAVVLEADDPAALSSWLLRNGFASTDRLRDWLAPYLRDKWKITAFKFDKADKSEARLGGKAVRLSFKTKQPFYPYREPAPAPRADDGKPAETPASAPRSRSLRVFYVAPAAASASLGGAAWGAQTSYAAPIRADDLKLGIPGVGGSPWLTIFEDRQFPRPATDEVFFGAAASATEIKPSPVDVDDPVVVAIPLDLVGLGLLSIGVTAAVVVLRRRGS